MSKARFGTHVKKSDGPQSGSAFEFVSARNEEEAVMSAAKIKERTKAHNQEIRAEERKRAKIRAVSLPRISIQGDKS